MVISQSPRDVADLTEAHRSWAMAMVAADEACARRWYAISHLRTAGWSWRAIGDLIDTDPFCVIEMFADGPGGPDV